MVISRWKRGGVPVSVALFDLEAGCPVSILPCFVTSLFMVHISFPRKQVKLKEQGTHSSSAHRANVGEKTNRKRKQLLPWLLYVQVWLLTVPLIPFIVWLCPRGPSEVQELSPGPCHVEHSSV